MQQVLGLRPFVPASDFALSQRFYRALGFDTTYADNQIAIFEMGTSGFILQNFHVKDLAENFMPQLRVRDVAGWWQRIDAVALTRDFGVREPRAPSMQSWGMKVGFLFDPAGVLWHIAEVPC